MQQTDAGTNGADRPDQVGIPHLSTSRKTREDYFGLGANNGSYFSIPINLPGGTGPNHGRFCTLRRNTFRGPAYYDFDFALIKNTPFGRRSSGIELLDLQFRAEFFNILNHANFNAPNFGGNGVTSVGNSGNFTSSTFGEIGSTRDAPYDPRQIQFALKLYY